MIHRGFWLLTGAALGVTGYRKATRLARAVTGQGLLGFPAATRPRSAVRRPAAVPAGHRGRAEQRPALPEKPPVTPAARIAATAARASAAAAFVRDVRDGMAEYWDLHRSEPGRTLESQRDGLSSGDSRQGRSER